MIFTLLCACGPLARGKSAYELAVDNGFKGTEAEWLESLKGASGQAGLDGKDGVNFNDGYTYKNLYEDMVAAGDFTGTLDQFIEKYFKPANDFDETALTNKACMTTCAILCEFEGTTTASAGSGVFYSVDRESGDALIITNFHVVYNESSKVNNPIAKTIHVLPFGCMNTQSPYHFTAEFVGGTTTYDLALLSVKGCDAIKNSYAEAVSFCEEEPVLGENVYAIGNPSNDGISVSKGVVSVVSEQIDLTNAYGDANSMRVLRFDAEVSHGNSGGGLFNAHGELLGIVNAKNFTTNVSGFNYAIPADVAKKVTEKIVLQCLDKSATEIYKPVLGVMVREENSIAVYDKTSGKVSIKAQVVIDTVSITSQFAAYFEPGDRLISVKHKDKTVEIFRNYHVVETVLGANEGDLLYFTIMRDGRLVTVNIKITSLCMSKVI